MHQHALLQANYHRATPAKLATSRRHITAVRCTASVEVQAPPSTVRLVGPQELEKVAWLRAEAFYEEDRSRFVQSLKKKFAGQEVEALQQRTAALPGSGAPLCECMVAVDTDSQEVLGCIDIRLPHSATSKAPMGVPADDASGAYILNVVVSEAHRGKGIGKCLMRAAMERVVSKWGAQRLYTHVAASNEVAYRLYIGCGFKEHSAESKFEYASTLGKLVLLQATADACQ